MDDNKINEETLPEDIKKTNAELSPNDSWNLWTKVYSDRDMRMKLYCRFSDPDDMTMSSYDTMAISKIAVDSDDENVVGYVRQAQLQAERRAAKFRSKRNSQQLSPTPTDSCHDCCDKLNCAKIDGCNCYFDYIDDDDAFADRTTKKRIKCIDDVLLESEACLWDWLRGKLTFVGPLHFTHPDIAKAIHKLPPSVRRSFDWVLGSIRVAEDFILVGPFVCLTQHAYWAKEMCFVARLDYKSPFKEIWEPCHPSEIKNDRQIIKYVRAMLIIFGPLSTTDNKILLMLRCLKEPLRGNPSYSPDGLCRLLENSPLFVMNKDICYLVREHEHFLGRAKVEDWHMDRTVVDDVMLPDK